MATSKTRHYRIPERATLIAQADRKFQGKEVRIQLYRDYDRYFFTAYVQGWRKMFVKQCGGRNAGEALKWYNANAEVIGADLVAL